MPRREHAREPYSYVDAETTVEGTLKAGARLRVDGRVRGEVRVEGVLEVAPGGRIEVGPVRAADVRIAGEIVADVHAAGTVELWNGGRLEGDVRAASLDIEEGATFLGRSLSPDAEAPTQVAEASSSQGAVVAPPDDAASSSEPDA